jgi:hypothetical protein
MGFEELKKDKLEVNALNDFEPAIWLHKKIEKAKHKVA